MERIDHSQRGQATLHMREILQGTNWTRNRNTVHSSSLGPVRQRETKTFTSIVTLGRRAGACRSRTGRECDDGQPRRWKGEELHQYLR